MGALHPTSPIDDLNEFSSIGDTVEDTVDTSEDEAIALMATTPGWKYIEALIGQIKSDLDGIMSQAIAQGASYEEIGRKTIIREITHGALDRITSRVRSARDTNTK